MTVERGSVIEGGWWLFMIVVSGVGAEGSLVLMVVLGCCVNRKVKVHR